MSWINKVFPVQSREAEMEAAVQNCINHIIDNSNEFTIKEQAIIMGNIKKRFSNIVVQGAELKRSELDEYVRVLDTL